MLAHSALPLALKGSPTSHEAVGAPPPSPQLWSSEALARFSNVSPLPPPSSITLHHHIITVALYQYLLPVALLSDLASALQEIVQALERVSIK